MAASRDKLLTTCAWLVHLYTASGAVAGLFTIELTAAGDYRGAFLLMALAIIIDSTDGALARAFQVRARIPVFDGATLDNLVDYLNYVVAPVFLMCRAGMLLSGRPGQSVAAAVLLASAYGFSRVDAKTVDHYFRGFPSYWNLVGLYLFCLHWTPMVNSAVALVLAIMVFPPLKFIYPSRTLPLQKLTLGLALLWGAATIVVIAQLPKPNHVLLYLSLAFVVYYFFMSFVLQLTTRLFAQPASVELQ